MRELQLVLSDDIAYAQTGERIPADETVIIALDNTTRELDLTAENAKKLRELIRPYIEAGHPAGQQSATSQEKSRESSITLARARSQVVRDFADNLGLKSPDGKRPIYRTASGGYYYPYKLMKMFREHQAAEAARGNPTPEPFS